MILLYLNDSEFEWFCANCSTNEALTSLVVAAIARINLEINSNPNNDASVMPTGFKPFFALCLIFDKIEVFLGCSTFGISLISLTS